MNNRNLLRAMTKNFYDYQDMRIRYAGRLKVKADGTSMSGDLPDMDTTDEAMVSFMEDYEKVREMENLFKKRIEKIVKKTPEWKNFLKGVKGCGPLMSAVLISEIDIEKSTTVSKIWQYAGLNPNTNVKGKKKQGKEVVETDEFVKADRPTKGYLLPYNAYLKKKLLGVLATSFIMQGSEYSKLYYDMKHRLQNSRKFVNGTERMWKDESALHIDRAAKRFMIQQFLVDYYRSVRSIYGLEVRDTYAEEKLGIKHHG